LARRVIMSESTNAQQSAIEAVARHFSATWQSAAGPPDAYLTVRGKKIALDVALIAPLRPRQKSATQARLREDKVAQRVLRDISSALHAQVPAGKAIILTLGAPIKLPSKLVAALASLLLAYLESGAAEVDEKKAILGNRIRFRVTHAKWATKVIGFVFTGDPAPGILANTLRSLHDEIAAKAKMRLPRQFSGDRWLVLHSDHWIADIKTYRYALSQLSPPHNFREILMVFDRGRVEPLDSSAPIPRRGIGDSNV
jgi:hypothetical protein